MKLLIVSVSMLLALVAAIQASSRQAGGTSLYTWVCEEKRCLRKLKSAVVGGGVPMDICKLNCDDLGSLWPKPTGAASVGKDLVSLYPQNILFGNINNNPAPIRAMLQTSTDIFREYIRVLNTEPYPVDGPAKDNKLQVDIYVTSDTTSITWATDESYTLSVTSSTSGSITTVTANISAVTFFGARHGLETLSQLIAYNGDQDALQVVSSASAVDKPVFRHRGAHLDTARNYYSLGKIKKVIDGLSYNKLNVFHWHITDSQSFPMEVTRRPKMMQYGVSSSERVYTKADIMDVVAYARQRGVKVIPELDQPAHSGYGYQWGALDGLGDLVVCVEDEPWYDFCVQPNCGQLNIVNPNVTAVVGDIFMDMFEMFDNDVFHMGGDEVDFRCYNSTKQITDWMLQNGFTLDREEFFRLWGEFQNRLQAKLDEASGTNTQVIMWNSGLTAPERIEQYLDNSKYVVQIWSESTDPAIGGVLQLGYKAIFTNVDALYLDCGFQAWLGNGHNWCAPIKGWQTVYDNNPEKIYASFTNDAIAAGAVADGQILGAETALWSEQSDDNAVESRIFPRAAAHAERTWTHPQTTHAEAETRMVTNRNRMAKRGILCDRLTEEYCNAYEGKCYAERIVVPDTGKSDSAAGSFYLSTVLMIISMALRLL